MTILPMFNLARSLPAFPVKEMVQYGTYIYYGERYASLVEHVKALKELTREPYRGLCDEVSVTIVNGIKPDYQSLHQNANLNVKVWGHDLTWRSTRAQIMDTIDVDYSWNYFLPWDAFWNIEFVAMLMRKRPLSNWMHEAGHLVREGVLLSATIETYLGRINVAEKRDGKRRPYYTAGSLLSWLYTKEELRQRDFRCDNVVNIPPKYRREAYLSHPDVVRIKGLFERGRLAEKVDHMHNRNLSIS